MKTIIGLIIVAFIASILSLKAEKGKQRMQVCRGGPKPVKNIP